MADTTLDARDEHGNWGPTYLEQMPAPMVWPPRALGTLKWLFGWPGYLWPWNAWFLGIALVTWFFLTPTLATMQTFEVWWIALIFGRNLGLTVLIFGGLHLYFYIVKGQGTDFKYTTRGLATKSKSRMFGSQVRENMFWSLASGVTIWTAYEVVTWWAYANGLLPFMAWASNPVWFVVLIVLIPMIREVHFLPRPSPAVLEAALSAGPLPPSPQRQHRAVDGPVDAPGGICAVLLPACSSTGSSPRTRSTPCSI